MSGHAFRSALWYGAETWHEDKGRYSEAQEYFRSDPNKGQRSSRDELALEMSYGCQLWSEEPMTRTWYIIGLKNHWLKCKALLESKLTQGSPEVNQRSNYLEMPYGHQIWSQEPLTRVPQIAGQHGVKGHEWIIWDQPEVKLSRCNPWPAYLA